jgi:flagellar hook-associated protein 1 FlgK
MSLGTFGGFNIAVRGLFANQKAMNVTAHNVANAKTPGYSRQQAIMETTYPFPMPSLNRPGGAGQMGTGVDVSKIARVRDLFLDKQVRNELAGLGMNEEVWQNLSQIETIFAEPNDKSGLAAMMNKFWDSWNELSKNAENSPIRTTVKELSNTIATTLNHIVSQLDAVHKDTNSVMEVRARQINAFASQISDLNQQIYNIKFAGDEPNDLMDKRDALMDELSKIVNFKSQPVLDKVSHFPEVMDTGMVQIQIDGHDLVNGQYYNKMFYNWNEANLNNLTPAPADPNDPAQASLEKLCWVSNGSPGTYNPGPPPSMTANGVYFNQLEKSPYPDPDNAADLAKIKQGKITVTGDGVSGTVTVTPGGDGLGVGEIKVEKGQLKGLFKTLEYIKGYSEKLNSFAYNLANKINATLKTGYDLQGNAQTTEDFFKGVLDEKTAASNIAFNTYFDNVSLIPVSKDPNASGDGNVAKDIYSLSNTSLTFTANGQTVTTTLTNYYKDLIAGLGVDASSAKLNQSNQQILVDQLNNKKDSISGVNPDEEMVFMVEFQKAYEASAKMINTLNEMLDTILGLKR